MATMYNWLDEAEKRGEKRGKKIGEKSGEKRGRFSLLVKIVNDYIEKNKISKKEACANLNVKYSVYMTAQRYLKSLES